jgi:hypothetical protein
LAHVDSPKGDLDHSNEITHSATTIASSTVYPYGTSERFPVVADSASVVQTNSAHAYMECSNKGICDRTTGQCECFDGYDGTACQRASCPNDCSGHGTCDTIASLAFKDSGNVYALWDKDASMGCSCDAGYTNADCSERQCKGGADPLYTDDNFIKGYTGGYSFNAPLGVLGGAYAIKIFDTFGQEYTTGPLALTDSATNNVGCVNIDAALAALPNNAGAGITCNTVAYAQSATDLLVNLDFAQHGAVKPIEIVEYLDGKRVSVTSTTTYTSAVWSEHIGESTDYFATKCAGVTVDVIVQAQWSVAVTKFAKTGVATIDGDIAPLQGSIGYVKASAAILNTLKSCLGDSDGITTNNVEIYNWDHGSVSMGIVDATRLTPVQYYPGSHPHAIKVSDDAGASDYVIVWWDAGQDANFQMRAVNMINQNPSTRGGFGGDSATPRTLSVYTTSGVVTQLAKDNHGVYHSGNDEPDRDGVLTNERNETKLTGYFDKGSNKIYTNYDGSCETGNDEITLSGSEEDGNLLHNCVEKGNLLFIVDGCWGAGDLVNTKIVASNPGYHFGGVELGCGPIGDAADKLIADAASGTGMLYTVTRVYTQDWTGNTTVYDAAGGMGMKGKEDRFVIEVDHNMKWDGSKIGNPDNSHDTSSNAGFKRLWGAGFTGLVVLFKFVPATDGSEYKYFSECSNRGSCDRETGLCACFKGYTSDNCSQQNALAV